MRRSIIAQRAARLLTAFVLLSILATGPGQVRPVWAAEEPDLRIDILGLAPGSQQDVLIRVTNVSRWWSQATRVGVYTRTPRPLNTHTENVIDLDPENRPDQGPTPFQYTFTYRLAAECNGHEIVARVSAGANYAGVQEVNLANNVSIRQVCADRGTSIDDGIDFGGCADCHIPVHMRTGEHTLEFTPSATQTRSRRTRSGVGNCPFGMDFGTTPSVGFWQHEGACSVTQVDQTAVRFDMTKLDEVPRKVLGAATLLYDEQVVNARHGDGSRRAVAGCVGVLGLATTEWVSNRTPANQFPNEFFNNAPGESTRQWDVLSHVARQQAFRDDGSLRFGYVLRGALEQVAGDDNHSCMSTVTNIRLRVTYTVLNR